MLCAGGEGRRTSCCRLKLPWTLLRFILQQDLLPHANYWLVSSSRQPPWNKWTSQVCKKKKKKKVTITTWHHLVTPNKWQLFFLENIWWHSLISTTSADARGVHADYRGDSAVNPVWSHSYHVDLPNEVLQEHLPGICGMTHILEALRGVSACLLQQNLLASWMLNAQKTLEHQLISQSAGCSLNSAIKQQEELLGIRCRHII